MAQFEPLENLAETLENEAIVVLEQHEESEAFADPSEEEEDGDSEAEEGAEEEG